MTSENGGQALRRLRTARNLTQRKLSQISGVSIAYISALETGAKDNPDEKILRALSIAMDLSEDESQYLVDTFLSSSSAVRARLARNEAAEIWVIGSRPPELLDPAYFQSLVDGILAGKKYTYWTSQPHTFRKLLDALVSLQTTTADPRTEFFEQAVQCIKTPAEASWFTFEIYDPYDPSRTSGNVLEIGRMGIAEATNALGEDTLQQVLEDLSHVYRTLRQRITQGISDLEYRHYEWYHPSTPNESPSRPVPVPSSLALANPTP